MKVGRNKEERKYIALAYDANENRVNVRTYYQYAIQFGSDIARLLGFPLAHDGYGRDYLVDITNGYHYWISLKVRRRVIFMPYHLAV